MAAGICRSCGRVCIRGLICRCSGRSRCCSYLWCRQILLEEQLDEFVRILAIVQRLDERLYYRDGPVISPCVAPTFEVMLFANMPMAQFAGFVEMRAQMHTQGDL